jgi:hypothetical protein
VDVGVPKTINEEGRAEYEYGCMATGLKNLGNKIEIEFRNKEVKTETTAVDLLLRADGPSSSLRKILRPDVKRNYAGYVARRRTVLEGEAPGSLKYTFVVTYVSFVNASLMNLSRLPYSVVILSLVKKGHRSLDLVS